MRACARMRLKKSKWRGRVVPIGDIRPWTVQSMDPCWLVQLLREPGIERGERGVAALLDLGDGVHIHEHGDENAPARCCPHSIFRRRASISSEVGRSPREPPGHARFYMTKKLS